MNHEIAQLQKTLNVAFPLVTEAIGKYGTTVYYRLLVMVQQNRKSGDMGSDSASGLFRRLLRNEAENLKQETIMEERSRSQDEMVRQWEEAKESGFVPSKSMLQAQLEQLYTERRLHEIAPRFFPPGYDELDYEQQEGVLLNLGMKGINMAIELGEEVKGE